MDAIEGSIPSLFFMYPHLQHIMIWWSDHDVRYLARIVNYFVSVPAYFIIPFCHLLQSLGFLQQLQIIISLGKDSSNFWGCHGYSQSRANKSNKSHLFSAYLAWALPADLVNWANRVNLRVWSCSSMDKLCLCHIMFRTNFISCI